MYRCGYIEGGASWKVSGVDETCTSPLYINSASCDTEVMQPQSSELTSSDDEAWKSSVYIESASCDAKAIQPQCATNTNAAACSHFSNWHLVTCSSEMGGRADR